ncbi:zinc finger protein 518A-like [Aplochiton taeniatus]
MEKVSDSDIEVDECIASVEDPSTSVQSDDENPESVFQDFNIIKIEEESIPVSEKQTPSKSSSASLGRIVEEHSDAIISHQLEKERTGSSAAAVDIVRPTKTTLRILKTPEGKQKMFLQTGEKRYAVPVQLQGNQGFKLLTKSSGPQINVSYMKPGIERQSNPPALALTLNNGRLSMSRPTPGVSEKGATLLSTVQPGAGTTKSHYFVNSTGLKGPLLLAGSTATNPLDKPTKTQPTCYLVQRPIPANATSNPSFKLTNSGSIGRQVLAMPVNPADKSSPLQTGRQAFLVRYITPAKSATQSSQPSDGTGNKVVFKIVRPAGGLLASGASTSTSQPMFLTTRPQTQCFLVASNKANTNAQTGIKQLFPIQNSTHQPVKLSYLLSPQVQHVKLKQHEGEKPSLAPRPIRPPSQRKRRRKALFDELPEPMPKTRRVTSKTFPEKEGPVLWKPVTKDVERTLRLCPFSSLQLIKCPRRYQPVVVLNHPDADIPEVCSIMKSVNRFKGAVSRVSLSRKTVQALSKLCQAGAPAPRPIENSLRERFLLKLKLRKKSKKKYEVVNSVSLGGERPSVFECWFCGRHFSSQEEWIGHGQRHLMEATRDWNKLF